MRYSCDLTYTGTILKRTYDSKNHALGIKFHGDDSEPEISQYPNLGEAPTFNWYFKDPKNIKILKSQPLNKVTTFNVVDPCQYLLNGQIHFKHYDKHAHDTCKIDGIILDRHYSHTFPHEDYYVKVEEPHGSQAGIFEYYVFDPVNIKTVKNLPMNKECHFVLYHVDYLGFCGVHFFNEKKAMSGCITHGPSKQFVNRVGDALVNHTSIGKYSFNVDKAGNIFILKNGHKCGVLENKMFGSNYQDSPAYLVASAITE